MLHELFIGGFGLIVLLVATFGHSGCGPELRQRTPFINALVVLTPGSLALRMGQPDLRLHMPATAALPWLAGAIVWSIRTLPKIFFPDPAE